MNTPNKLSILRFLLAPCFYILWQSTLQNPHKGIFLVLVVIYLISEGSDVLDGYIARKYSLVTDLGRVLDPFADVIGRITVFYCLAITQLMPQWFFLIILYRELAMTFGRMMMIKAGISRGASVWGKLKGVMYHLSGDIGLVLVGYKVFGPNLVVPAGLEYLALGVFITAMITSVFSFVMYFPEIYRSLK